jgi:hypothetical protein
MTQLDAFTVDAVFGCHLWNGRIDQRDGYGLVWRGRTPIKAHIAAWTAKNGPVPEGKVLDHRCRRRLCLRHLEVVTQSENLIRRDWGARNRRPICALKHDVINVMTTPEGGRLCRLCDR